jgi:hypothetical protein
MDAPCKFGGLLILSTPFIVILFDVKLALEFYCAMSIVQIAFFFKNVY